MGRGRVESLLTLLDENSVCVERLDEDVVSRVAVKRLLQALLVKVVTTGGVVDCSRWRCKVDARSIAKKMESDREE